MKKKQPAVLVVILNYCTYDMTINLVKQLHKSLNYENFDIMVIDNCSPNESTQVLKQKSQEMNFLFYSNKKNAGYAAGNNIGIRYAIGHGYAYSWILNNDVEIRESSVLLHMVATAESDERIGCVGPMIYTLDGTVCAPYCRRLSAWGMTGGIIAERRYRRRFSDRAGYVYRVYGCCMLLKNKIMSEINCMDERTFLYGEEDILAERMLIKGYRSYYDASVSVTHKESSSVKKSFRNRKRTQILETNRSMELYLKEYRKFPAIVRVACKIVRSIIIWLR